MGKSRQKEEESKDYFDVDKEYKEVMLRK